MSMLVEHTDVTFQWLSQHVGTVKHQKEMPRPANLCVVKADGAFGALQKSAGRNAQLCRDCRSDGAGIVRCTPPLGRYATWLGMHTSTSQGAL